MPFSACRLPGAHGALETHVHGPGAAQWRQCGGGLLLSFPTVVGAGIGVLFLFCRRQELGATSVLCELCMRSVALAAEGSF